MTLCLFADVTFISRAVWTDQANGFLRAVPLTMCWSIGSHTRSLAFQGVSARAQRGYAARPRSRWLRLRSSSHRTQRDRSATPGEGPALSPIS